MSMLFIFRGYRRSIRLCHHTRFLSTAVANANDKPYYITTPIFYPNASPHIGHLYSLVIGDVFARYQRLRGRRVEYLTGTDEHGLKIQKAAKVWNDGGEGKEREFCDLLSQRFRDLGKRASISNTCFMRTSDEGHHRAVQDVWSKLQAEGLIYKGEYSGWYSITDECFYTDSQVVTVPLSPSSSTLSSLPTQDNLPQSETISLETGSTVELTSETNYMFRLSSFRSLLLEHYSSNPDIVHPPQYYQEVLAMLGQGDSATATELADISISRPRSRLSWGVEVPGDQEQTVYVWFDALLIYLTGAGYPWSPPLCNASQTSPPTESQWPWPADLQVIGKDILKFHAIYFPAILLALSSSSTQRLSPALPKRLLTHAHWTSNQKKMSKSLGNVADPMAFIRARGEEKKAGAYDVDAVRFYLMRVGGRWRDDVDWSEEQLDKHVKEAQSQLGNYFLRITSPKIAARAVKADSTDATHNAGPGHELNTELLAMSRSLPGKVAERMDALEAGEALDEIMQVLKFANRAVTIIAPWSATSPPQLVRETRLVALETLRMVGICMQPYMPGVGQTLLGALGLPIEDVAWEADETKESWEEVQRRWDERVVEGVRLFL